jgi:hypothetical protein
MKAEEKSIWNQHQSRLAEISRERTETMKSYETKMEAIGAAQSSQPQILTREKQQINRDTETKLRAISNKEFAEIGRYMKEIEDYDQSQKKENKEEKSIDKKSEEMSVDQLKEKMKQELKEKLSQRELDREPEH